MRALVCNCLANNQPTISSYYLLAFHRSCFVWYSRGSVSSFSQLLSTHLSPLFNISIMYQRREGIVPVIKLNKSRYVRFEKCVPPTRLENHELLIRIMNSRVWPAFSFRVRCFVPVIMVFCHFLIILQPRQARCPLFGQDVLGVNNLTKCSWGPLFFLVRVCMFRLVSCFVWLVVLKSCVVWLDGRFFVVKKSYIRFYVNQCEHHQFLNRNRCCRERHFVTDNF